MAKCDDFEARRRSGVPPERGASGVSPEVAERDHAVRDHTLTVSGAGSSLTGCAADRSDPHLPAKLHVQRFRINPRVVRSMNQTTKGMLIGFLGIVCFSLTLPATRLAVASFDPMLVGLGRELVAGSLALVVLLWTKQERPNATQFRRLLFVMVCVVFGFPMLMSWAMQRVPAAHGAVMLGVLPLLTAMAGAVRAHERPSLAFWALGIAGSLCVIVFAYSEGGGHFGVADLALLGSAIFAAFGYAEGAMLARELGGWQVISWATVIGIPFVVGPVAWLIWKQGLHATPSAWLGMAYVSVFSAYLGFFAWYRGLALGGVARVGQVQLLQPFLTMAFAAVFMGEHFGPRGVIVAGLVGAAVYFSRKCRISHKPLTST